MKFVAIDKNNPEMVRAAEVATSLLNTPEFNAQVERETIKEYCQQVVFGSAPSEGIPDVRPRYPRWSGCA